MKKSYFHTMTTTEQWKDKTIDTCSYLDGLLGHYGEWKMLALKCYKLQDSIYRTFEIKNYKDGEQISSR